MLHEKCISAHRIVGFMSREVYLYEKLFHQYKVNNVRCGYRSLLVLYKMYIFYRKLYWERFSLYKKDYYTENNKFIYKKKEYTFPFRLNSKM